MTSEITTITYRITEENLIRTVSDGNYRSPISNPKDWQIEDVQLLAEEYDNHGKQCAETCITIVIARKPGTAKVDENKHVGEA